MGAALADVPAPKRQLKPNDSVCSIKSMGEDVSVMKHEGFVFLDTLPGGSQVLFFNNVAVNSNTS